MLHVFSFLFIATILSSSAAQQYQEKSVKRSKLILEYNWPEPSKSLTRLPHPRSCHHFIHTKHDGSHVVKRCHGDKVFDYRSLRCQNKASAKCWMNIVKKDNTKQIKQQFSCPYPWGLYPDKEDCSVFYNCLGGKVYTRKCPDSTLFDVVERHCVHSRKALCAQESDEDTFKERNSWPANSFVTSRSPGRNGNHNLGREESGVRSNGISIRGRGESDHRVSFGNNARERYGNDDRGREGNGRIGKFTTVLENVEDTSDKTTVQPRFSFETTASKKKDSRTNVNVIITTIPSKPSGTFDIDSKGSTSEEESSSEDVAVKYHTNSRNILPTSKLPFTTAISENLASFRTAYVDSKEDNSEEGTSSREVGEEDRAKSGNNFTSSKLPFVSTSAANPESLRTKGGLKEDGSEEISEKETKYKNKFISSKLPLVPFSTANPKPFERTNRDSKEENNEISSKYESKPTTPKIRTSTGSNHRKEITEEIYPISKIMFAEKRNITPPSHGDNSSELPLRSSTIKALASAEDKLEPVIITVASEAGKEDDNINDDIQKIPRSTEIISKKLAPSSDPFTHKEHHSITKFFFTPEPTKIRPEIAKDVEVESTSKTTFSTLCQNSDGKFPHPRNRRLFIACVGKEALVMICPKSLVYDSNSESCIYGEK